MGYLNIFRKTTADDATGETSKSRLLEATHGWQGTKHTIRERNAVMLLNELMSDIHFMVGQKGKSHLLEAVD